jgi:hypothetical protein
VFDNTLALSATGFELHVVIGLALIFGIDILHGFCPAPQISY